MSTYKFHDIILEENTSTREVQVLDTHCMLITSFSLNCPHIVDLGILLSEIYDLAYARGQEQGKREATTQVPVIL